MLLEAQTVTHVLGTDPLVEFPVLVVTEVDALLPCPTEADDDDPDET